MQTQALTGALSSNTYPTSVHLHRAIRYTRNDALKSTARSALGSKRFLLAGPQIVFPHLSDFHVIALAERVIWNEARMTHDHR